MSTSYTKLPARKLRQLLAAEIKAWHELPRRDSFSGLAISGRLDAIQQELNRRNLPFKPFYTEIGIEIG